MTESFLAINNFMDSNQYNRGWQYSSIVKANSENKCIYSDRTEWQITYDDRYEQYAISILWTINDEAWRSLSLHGIYNTNFQTFRYEDNKLIILDHTNKIRIVVAGNEGIE